MVNSKKKVLIITNGAFPVPATKGGAVEGLVENLVKENNIEQTLDMTVFSIFDKDAEVKANCVYSNVHFHFVKPAKIWMGLDKLIHWIAFDMLHKSNHLAYATIFERLSYIHSAGVYLHSHSFDRVVFENQMASLWALKYKDNMKRYADRSILHLHNHPARYAHCEKIAAGLHKVIGVSSFIVNDEAKKIGIPLNSQKLGVLKNCIDTDLFDPQTITAEDTLSVRKRLNVLGRYVILFAGRLIPGKGVKELIQAFKQVDNQNAVLVIVGSMNFNSSSRSSYEEDLKKEITEDIKPRVIFTGYVQYEDMPKYYAMADLVVLPSTCEEAAGLTMMEAVAMQKPLITTTMGGIPEYVGDDCAVMVENDSNLVENLAKKMNQMIETPDISENFTKAELDRRAEWEVKKYYNNFCEVLDQ